MWVGLDLMHKVELIFNISDIIHVENFKEKQLNTSLFQKYNAGAQ